MTIGLSKEEELKYLDKALLAIDGQLELFGDFKTKKDSEIKSNRRFLWDSMKEMDELEVQSMNEELRMQEKIYINNQKKINTLLAQKNSPYFARIDFKEDGEDYADSLYIGISSIVEDDFDFIALDWRSPISNMFYDYEMGKASYEAPNGIVEGEIILNRQYNIKNSELKFIHDSKSSIHDEALLEVLSNNTSDKMKNIVSSIQREQNSIIRNEDAKILLLQGVAGSGKTSIAMHRAAFLLYKYRKTLKANNVLIFSPNDVFSDYIGDVLPGLGEDNIQTTTLEQYGKMFLPSILKYESKNEYLEWLYKENKSKVDLERLTSIDFKNSFEFIEILDSFTTKLPKLLGNFSPIVFDGKALIPKNKVEETFLVRFKSLPIIKRIEALKESLYSQIETKYLLQAKKKNSSDFGYDPIDAGCSIEEYFKINIDEQVNNMFKTLSITKIYEMLWNHIDDFTNNDINTTKESTIESIKSGMVNYEDVIPLIYLRSSMEGFRNYMDIKHIIIDECQDYSPMFYMLIKKSFNKASATILGDLNQRISGSNSLSKKEEISEVFGEENTTYMSLNKSYRSTINITNFSKQILLNGEDIQGVERVGLEPVLYDDNVVIKDIIEEMKNRGMKTIAIIPKTLDDANELYTKLKSSIEDLSIVTWDSSNIKGEITVIPSYIAKGLEFDGVIIPDGDSTYSLDSERNLLYTVCSRALHELHIITNGDKSILLP